MSTLAEVRQDFIKLTNRYDLLTVAGISANVDNGANAFLNAGLRWLDTRIKHRKSFKKFIKVLATGDFTFTVPDYIEFKHLKMITATDEIDLTTDELSIGDFHNTYSRPYADWTSGQPTAWAVNDDILVDEIESSVPQDALGQSDVRRVPATREFLLNNDFSEEFIDESLTDFGGSATTLQDRVPSWQMNGIANQEHNRANNSVDVNGSLTTGDYIIRQAVTSMAIYPDLLIDYLLTFTISNYVSGSLTIHFGDGLLAIPKSADGILAGTVKPQTYAVNPYVEIRAGLTGAFDLEISNVSLTEVGFIRFVEKTFPQSVRDRTGIIFNPPTDKARTVEFYARFFTAPMSTDTDRNFYTDNYPLLLAQAGAYELEKGNQSTARIRYWLEAMQPTITELEEVFIEEEMTFMENSYERTR